MTGETVEGRAGGKTRPRDIGLSSALFTVAAVLATAGSLSDSPMMLSIAAMALALFVILEFRRIRRAQQIAALVLFGIAVVIALARSELAHTISAGLQRTLPFLLVFAAVGWLRAAAAESPSVEALRDGLARMREGHRFSALALAAHVLGAGFNLAGLGLLAPMLNDRNDDPETARRLRCAIVWGFSSASSWSPFLVGTAAVLAALPSIAWVQTLPYGLVIAAGFLIWAMFYDHQTRRNRAAARSQPEPVSLRQLDLKRPVVRLLVAIAILFTMTLFLIEGVGFTLTTSIALVAPSYALAWLFSIHRGQSRSRVPDIGLHVLSGYREMRTETTLFVAANSFGVAVSEVLPAAIGKLGFSGGGLTGLVFFDALAVFWAYLLVCAIGLHPIVSLVVFTAITDPATLGIPLPLLGAVMMALWGMGTSVSPLSATTLFMSQMSKASSFTIAWRWNGLFVALGSFWLAAVLSLAS